MIFGMHGPCTSTDAFRGKILYLNGEDNCAGGQGFKYIIGPPISNCGKYTLDVTYAAIVEPLLRPYTRTRVTAYPVHKRFLAYVNSKCVPSREKLFDAIVRDDRLPEPTAGGKCHGAHPEVSDRNAFKRGHFLKNYKDFKAFKYAIAAEHGITPGYVTEKLLSVLLSGAIPVYTGSTAVFSIFNAAAFIYYPESNPRAALDRIAALEQDHAAYLKMANEPMFAPGAQQYLFPGLVPQIHALLAK